MSSPFRELTPRQRKSRSGCKRCKERKVGASISLLPQRLTLEFSKVKCDESLPSCHQCQRRGLGCPGYNRNLNWVQHRELSASGLKVITNPKRISHGQNADSESIPAASILDPGLWPISPSVLHVREQQFGLDLFLFEQPIGDLNQGDAFIQNRHVFQYEMGTESNSIHDKVRREKEDHEDTFVIDLSSNDQSLLPSLQDTTTFLVEYYFSNVCPIVSCFDSPSNPFRYEISNMIQTSSALSNCIQAMSAAHLSILQPSRHRHGLEFQNATVRSISNSIANDPEVSEELLISVILLGVTQVS